MQSCNNVGGIMIPEKLSSLIANCLFIKSTCLLYFVFPTAIKGLPQ